MKYVMIIIDGIGDDPIEELSMRTPLEAAFIPNINYIASRGQIGTINTAFNGFPIESMVCIMGILGYDPKYFYPCGRASFEAMAQGISIGENDLVFRCNIVELNEDENSIKDFTAGLISDTEAKKFLRKVNRPKNTWEIYPGQSYRNLLIIRDAELSADNINCYPPHMHIGEKINNLKPFLNSLDKNNLIEDLWSFLLKSYNNNQKRMLWAWSPSKSIEWPSFKELTGLKGAVVCGLDFLKGIAMAGDMEFENIPGATGYTDTNYEQKAIYSKKYIENNDFVLVHINATDELAHQRDYIGKIKAIEKIDELIVGPILKELRSKFGDEFRMVICGDHKTRCKDGKHVGDPVPYLIYGKDVKPSKEYIFSEKECGKYNAIESLNFIRENLILK
ncbi:2,3-bisphosphoglycerate-independent phosphoglycerate mutase [Clostridium fallax]|uniref:2,3-bisphosphoglycerate-independent phosphoglycerate mutase n=1 Tax=Clostridium fallax TaxID=1533 RepID=A0A1M4ULA6_9CLOT|nr:2,3-bisphosphoglycerate-independent phosphoglycerate mutase [Clostridium fallax]SHE57353.1 2,3-bisphosphoglycerate-independent phosphoglycerate mutase [Clostridium fallax]SQB07622.1 2,3-bisphosphoglycerate-independent phosphoglycerate mutase ApgM [Clostridium fallax]